MALSRGVLMQLQLLCENVNDQWASSGDFDLLLVLAKIHDALGRLVAHLIGQHL